MYVSDEYSELRQELKNGLVIDPPRFCKKFQNLAPMLHTNSSQILTRPKSTRPKYQIVSNLQGNFLKV